MIYYLNLYIISVSLSIALFVKEANLTKTQDNKM